jgi:tetratricopeptide (TPR) repeat protein
MSDTGPEVFAQALAMLQSGQLARAVPLLKTYVEAHQNDVDALHNLGMALSDLGQLDEARRYLLNALDLAPQHTNTLVALGLASDRGEDRDAALGYLRRAVEQDVENPYAQRSLGGVLAKLGRYAEAEPHLRAAYALTPNDQATAYGLALDLTELGGEARLRESNELYRHVIDLNPQSQVAELARQERSKLAQRSLRQASNGPRLDAVMYCLSALEQFEQLSPERVKAIALEIALLGRTGLDINNPATRYHLQNLQGDFTGLQLMSMLHVASKQIAPDADIAFDLANEYEAAINLHGRRPVP